MKMKQLLKTIVLKNYLKLKKIEIVILFDFGIPIEGKFGFAFLFMKRLTR